MGRVGYLLFQLLITCDLPRSAKCPFLSAFSCLSKQKTSFNHLSKQFRYPMMRPIIK